MLQVRATRFRKIPKAYNTSRLFRATPMRRGAVQTFAERSACGTPKLWVLQTKTPSEERVLSDVVACNTAAARNVADANLTIYFAMSGSWAAEQSRSAWLY